MAAPALSNKTRTGGTKAGNRRTGGEDRKIAVTMPNGVYEGTIKSGRFVEGKNQSLLLFIELILESGESVKLGSLLLDSMAGNTTLIQQNTAIFLNLAGMPADADVLLDDALDAMIGRKVQVKLIAVDDHRGAPTNEIIDVITSIGADDI
jgi:hypothetical protein